VTENDKYWRWIAERELGRREECERKRN